MSVNAQECSVAIRTPVNFQRPVLFYDHIFNNLSLEHFLEVLGDQRDLLLGRKLFHHFVLDVRVRSVAMAPERRFMLTKMIVQNNESELMFIMSLSRSVQY